MMGSKLAVTLAWTIIIHYEWVHSLICRIKPKLLTEHYIWSTAWAQVALFRYKICLAQPCVFRTRGASGKNFVQTTKAELSFTAYLADTYRRHIVHAVYIAIGLNASFTRCALCTKCTTNLVSVVSSLCISGTAPPWQRVLLHQT